MEGDGARREWRRGARRKAAALLAGLVLLGLVGAALREILKSTGGRRS